MGKKSRRRRVRPAEQSLPPHTEVQPPEQSASPPEVQREEESASPPEFQLRGEIEVPRLRESADNWIDRFQQVTTRFPDDPWHHERVESLYSYNISLSILFSCFGDMDGLVTEKDRKFLRELRREASTTPQPAFFTATARRLCALVSKYDGWYRFREVVEYFDKAVALCDSASMEERERILNLHEETIRPVTVKVGDHLLHLRSECRHYENLCREAWCQETNPYNTDGDPSKPVFLYPGIQCDGCREHRCDLGLSKLELCTSCQLVYYCSRDCQVKAWHDGHKNMCRKPGEFKYNDVAYILDPVKKAVCNDESENYRDGLVVGNFTVGQRVRVLRPSSDDTSKLVVQDLIGDILNVFGVVAVRKLRRCEASRWYVAGKDREAVGARFERLKLSDKSIEKPWGYNLR